MSSVATPTPTVDPTAANDAVEIIKIIEVISPTPASATPGDVELLDFGETPPSEDDSSPTLFEPVRLTDIISSTLQVSRLHILGGSAARTEASSPARQRKHCGFGVKVGSVHSGGRTRNLELCYGYGYFVQNVKSLLRPAQSLPHSLKPSITCSGVY